MIDDLDARLIALLDAEPRLPMLELARRLSVARGTAQARLDRLLRAGVVTGFGPQVDPTALGYPVAAYTTLEMSQGAREGLLQQIAGIPEVLEASTVTGAGDLFCRVVARSNAHLQQVVDDILALDGVVRATTLVTLTTPLPARLLPLVRQAAAVGLDAAP